MYGAVKPLRCSKGAEKRADKKPTKLISCCLPSYGEGFREAFEANSLFGGSCTYISDASLGKTKNNNDTRECVNGR